MEREKVGLKQGDVYTEKPQKARWLKGFHGSVSLRKCLINSLGEQK